MLEGSAPISAGLLETFITLEINPGAFLPKSSLNLFLKSSLQSSPFTVIAGFCVLFATCLFSIFIPHFQFLISYFYQPSN